MYQIIYVLHILVLGFNDATSGLTKPDYNTGIYAYKYHLKLKSGNNSSIFGYQDPVSKVANFDSGLINKNQLL